MAEKKKLTFKGVLLIWAAVFLIATACGLVVFWNYLDAYEISRPEYAMDAYLAQLSKEELFDKSSLAAELDGNLEPEETARALTLQKLEGDLAYVLRAQESTEETQVYAILCGRKTVGTVTLAQQAEIDFSMKPWAVTAESYDLAWLIDGETVSVNVPGDYTVKVNGVALDESYITQRDVEYPVLEELQVSYELPTMVTYEAGPFLGTGTVELLDAAGNPAQADEVAYLSNCTAEETEELDEFAELFVKRFVAYAGSNNDTRSGYLGAVLRYVIPGSKLEQRLRSAMDGLQYGQSKGDKVVSIATNQYTRLSEGVYFLDVSYEVDTLGNSGTIRTTTNAKLVAFATDQGLRAEFLMNY